LLRLPGGTGGILLVMIKSRVRGKDNVYADPTRLDHRQHFRFTPKSGHS
jgi:hypothetical protein